MRSSRLVLALAASTCIACVHKPEMHLDHAEISGVQLATSPPSLGIVMVVVINVFNPNSYDVAVRGVRGQAILAYQYPLPVSFQAPPDGVWMPAGQITAVRVPITLPIELAIALVQQGMASPTIPYRFMGSADVTATRAFQLEKDNYSVDETGSITRAEMMSVIPQNPFVGLPLPFMPH